MTDKRAFAKFDVGYLDNPKMLDVMDASSNAILMHFASILYCAQHLTDGVVASKAMQRKTGGTDADVRILLDAGLWHDPEHGCETCPQPPAGKVYVHDFLEHNRAAEEAKRVSEKRSKAASARWDKGKKPMQIALQDAVQNDDVCNAEREREKEREITPSATRRVQDIPRADVDAVIEFFCQQLNANDVRYTVGKQWRNAARLLIDTDGYTVPQINMVARFATTDNFWKANVLSLPKLREKFETLKVKAQSQSAESRPTVSAQYGWAN